MAGIKPQLAEAAPPPEAPQGPRSYQQPPPPQTESRDGCGRSGWLLSGGTSGGMKQIEHSMH